MITVCFSDMRLNVVVRRVQPNQTSLQPASFKAVSELWTHIFRPGMRLRTKDSSLHQHACPALTCIWSFEEEECKPMIARG